MRNFSIVRGPSSMSYNMMCMCSKYVFVCNLMDLLNSQLDAVQVPLHQTDLSHSSNREYFVHCWTGSHKNGITIQIVYLSRGVHSPRKHFATHGLRVCMCVYVCLTHIQVNHAWPAQKPYTQVSAANRQQRMCKRVHVCVDSISGIDALCSHFTIIQLSQCNTWTVSTINLGCRLAQVILSWVPLAGSLSSHSVKTWGWNSERD